MKDKTIMQRWKEAKTSFRAGLDRAVEARNEAAQIIARECGQQAGAIEVSKGKFKARVFGTAYVVGTADTRTSHILEGKAIEDHWHNDLRDVEAAAAWLNSLTTGDFIAQWEKQQN
jgi:hypothetical protein